MSTGSSGPSENHRRRVTQLQGRFDQENFNLPKTDVALLGMDVTDLITFIRERTKHESQGPSGGWERRAVMPLREAISVALAFDRLTGKTHECDGAHAHKFVAKIVQVANYFLRELKSVFSCWEDLDPGESAETAEEYVRAKDDLERAKELATISQALLNLPRLLGQQAGISMEERPTDTLVALRESRSIASYLMTHFLDAKVSEFDPWLISDLTGIVSSTVFFGSKSRWWKDPRENLGNLRWVSMCWLDSASKNLGLPGVGGLIASTAQLWAGIRDREIATSFRTVIEEFEVQEQDIAEASREKQIDEVDTAELKDAYLQCLRTIALTQRGPELTPFWYEIWEQGRYREFALHGLVGTDARLAAGLFENEWFAEESAEKIMSKENLLFILQTFIENPIAANEFKVMLSRLSELQLTSFVSGVFDKEYNLLVHGDSKSEMRTEKFKRFLRASGIVQEQPVEDAQLVGITVSTPSSDGLPWHFLETHFDSPDSFRAKTRR